MKCIPLYDGQLLNGTENCPQLLWLLLLSGIIDTDYQVKECSLNVPRGAVPPVQRAQKNNIRGRKNKAGGQHEGLSIFKAALLEI